MSAIRLISEEILTYIPNPSKDTFQKQKSYVIPSPQGKSIILAFVSHLHDGPDIPPLVQYAIQKDIGVVYVCDKMPLNPIVDSHIHYLETPDKWFIHTLFLNPLAFASVVASRSAQRLAMAFSEFTQYHIPVIRQERDIQKLYDEYEHTRHNILVEVFGGVGDHLLTIPALKTLAARGKNVYVLCEPHRNSCFHNLPYIKGFYAKRNEVDISKFRKVIYLNFGQLLNDYRQDFNKQNRIYAVAELCGLRPEELVTDRPEIILTADEKNNIERKWGPYQKKIFLGFDSARVDSKLPNSMTQDIINRLKGRGYTVFVTSVRRHNFENCIDLNKKVSLREMFALISTMECVLTVDTSFLHVAGAFNKRTFCVMNYFKPAWRCSTYPNCTAYTPNVACFPCVSKQFVPSREWQCHNKSCYEYQKWEQIYSDIDTFFKKKYFKETEAVPVSKEAYVPEPPKKVDEERFPGKIIKVRPEASRRIAAFWMGGLGDAVMLGYLCRAIKRKYPDSKIDAFVRDLNQVQLFVFDYPQVKAQYSGYSWGKTVGLHKNDYDIVYEFRHYPYVWYKYDPKLNKPFNKELYDSWQKASTHVLNVWDKEIFRYYAKQTDLELTDEDLRIPLLNHNDPCVKSKLTKYKLPKEFITISSGCDQNVGVIKLWPQERWVELVERLNKKGISLIQLGSKYDKEIPGARKVQCENFIDLMYILQQSKLHVSNEGGLIHLAHGVGTKSVSLFGPTDPILYGYPDNINLYVDKCPSCWWAVHEWSRRCKKGYKICKNLDKVTPYQVYKKILEEIG